MPAYRTLAAPVEHEIPKIKGSRFLAFAARATTEAEAVAHVAAVRKRHHAARHVCWAWRTLDSSPSSPPSTGPT